MDIVNVSLKQCVYVCIILTQLLFFIICIIHIQLSILTYCAINTHVFILKNNIFQLLRSKFNNFGNASAHFSPSIINYQQLIRSTNMGTVSTHIHY